MSLTAAAGSLAMLADTIDEIAHRQPVRFGEKSCPRTVKSHAVQPAYRTAPVVDTWYDEKAFVLGDIDPSNPGRTHAHSLQDGRVLMHSHVADPRGEAFYSEERQRDLDWTTADVLDIADLLEYPNPN